jgi:HJR/Mrr/RecB family endonuclease
MNPEEIASESSITQMTGFQRTAGMFNQLGDTNGATFIGGQLKAQQRWHKRMMGYADAKSLEDLFTLSYELFAEPVLETPETKIILLDEVARIKSAIKEIYRDNQIIYRLEPRDFEEMVAELLRKQDFKVELTKQTRDGGYDLIALQNISGFPNRFLVECKRHASHRPVGVNIIRSFCQVMSEEKNNGIIVTSSYFSAEAMKYREKFQPYNLHFRDRDDILEWVNKYVASGS